MNYTQRALRFSCGGSFLVGIIDVPERPLARGVLVIAGGPQYRVGGHRQFALLARMLAQRGIPVMRFDHRGMGDSEDEVRSFDAIDDDVHAAIGEFSRQMPKMEEVVIWGLCDAATAAALYAHTDVRVHGLILLNPWVSAPDGSGRTGLRHYYLGRLGELGFWKKVATGHLDFGAGAAALRQYMREAAADRSAPLPQRVVASLSCFDGQVLVILSGEDPTARAFADLMSKHEIKCRRVDIADADHTFASRVWRDEVAQISANWFISW